MSDAALLVENVESGYGKTQILRGVNLRVDESTCVALIGPNGHGKTTLLRTISGLHPAWNGSVRVHGKEVTGSPARRLVEIGVVHAAQGDALFGDLTVEEHLIVALRRLRRRDRRIRISEAYEMFPRLEERRLRRARTLSGGEKRMLSIARTLLLDGKVFLIDEPSLGLSPLMVDEVYRHIGELARRGLTLLLVEENPVRLRGIAETIYLLDRGRIVASGPTEALLQDESLLETYLGITHEVAERIAEETMGDVVQVLYTAAVIGAAYSLMGSGLTLIWGGLRFPNMAHGALFTAGGFAAFWIVTENHIAAWAGVLCGFFIAGGLAIVIYLVLYRPLLRKPHWPTSTLMAGIGVAVALQAWFTLKSPRDQSLDPIVGGKFKLP